MTTLEAHLPCLFLGLSGCNSRCIFIAATWCHRVAYRKVHIVVVDVDVSKMSNYFSPDWTS